MLVVSAAMRGGSNWAAVPIITVSIDAWCYGMAWVSGRYPASLNVPNQEKYDMLSAEDKQEVVAVVQRFTYWFTAVWTVFSVLLVASDSQSFIVVALVLAMISEGALGIGLIFKITRKINQLHESEYGALQ